VTALPQYALRRRYKPRPTVAQERAQLERLAYFTSLNDVTIPLAWLLPNVAPSQWEFRTLTAPPSREMIGRYGASQAKRIAACPGCTVHLSPTYSLSATPGALHACETCRRPYDEQPQVSGGQT
jgi:hypothetical protein